MFKLLQKHSQPAFETATTCDVSDLTLSRTYLLCEKDAAVLPPIQEQMAASFSDMKVIRINSGHSPQLAQPDCVVEIIDTIAKT